MSKAMTTMEQPDDLVGKPNLLGPVSNMLKDGSPSGPPTLFRHASMQKIRHCCQNLNLFPYLLYSFDNSKSHPFAQKVHLCLSRFLQLITARVFLLCKCLRLSLLRGVSRSDESSSRQEPSTEIVDKGKPWTKLFATETREKCKRRNPWFLILAVYLVPLILAFQLCGLFAGLTVFGKLTPGFVFLIAAFVVVTYLTFKVFLYHLDEESVKRSEKTKTK